MSTPIKIESESHWHELRGKVVGSSEVAALFDASPFPHPLRALAPKKRKSQ